MSLELAVKWFGNHINNGEGIVITDKQTESYPEVSGYCIPTLLKYGFKKEAKQFAEWLVNTQNPNGSWGLRGYPFLFDTIQIINGLNYFDHKYIDAINRAQVFIGTQISQDGSFSSEYHSSNVPIEINLYAAQWVDSNWGLYCNEGVFRFNKMLHFYCYILDACLGIQCLRDRSIHAINHLAELQRPDGSIPAVEGQDWVCYPGIAQAACLFFDVGLEQNAIRALEYLDGVQNKSGGWYGSNANYFPTQEPSWAVKFYLDAYYKKISHQFERESPRFVLSISSDDVRIKFIDKYISAEGTVLDAGCGRGRIAKVYKERGINVIGMDLSVLSVNECKKIMEAYHGNILGMPFNDGMFNSVYMVEVLEHAPIFIENALREAHRVLKDGGRFILVDKDRNCKVKLVMGQDEQWFDAECVSFIMKKFFKDVKYEQLDEMFIGWVGTK